MGSSTQTIILSSPFPPVPHLGDVEKSAPADASSDASAGRSSGVPKNASKKKEPVATTSSKIYKGPQPPRKEPVL